MTTATVTPFVIERIDLRDPDGTLRPEVRKCETVTEAAEQFDSEGSPLNWPLEDIGLELEAEGRVEHVDEDAGFEVIARRVS